VFEQLGVDGQAPAQLRAQATGAKKLAEKLSSLPTDDLRDLLSSFLRRVVIGEEQIQVMIGRNDLCQLFKNGGKAIASNLSERRRPVDPSDLICLSIEARMKRYGGVVHLVVRPNPTTTAASKTKPSLLKALARAHRWYQSVLEGKAHDVRALALHAGLTERYVGKVFPCAFLAPDIVESILQGHQPDDLTFARLCREIPLSWTEQRRQLGFPPVPSR
jgi:hypothetical protein